MTRRMKYNLMNKNDITAAPEGCRNIFCERQCKYWQIKNIVQCKNCSVQTFYLKKLSKGLDKFFSL